MRRASDHGCQEPRECVVTVPYAACLAQAMTLKADGAEVPGFVDLLAPQGVLGLVQGPVRVPEGAIFHSDNAAQYASKEFAKVCRRLGVTRSRGAVGTSADNAAAENFHATLKRETLQGKKPWSGAREARLVVFRWVTRYNTRRRHSGLGYSGPIAFEQRSVTLAATASLTPLLIRCPGCRAGRAGPVPRRG